MSFKVDKQSKLSAAGDLLMLPIMYLLQGNFREIPQRTHRWNNVKLSAAQVKDFDASKVETVAGDENAHKRWLGFIPLFHMPIFGGWKKFVVLQPKEHHGHWYIGWLVDDAFGVSQIPVVGKVRLGIGPIQAQYFGVDQEGKQIDIDIVGYGSIGDAGEFAKTPLL